MTDRLSEATAEVSEQPPRSMDERTVQSQPTAPVISTEVRIKGETLLCSFSRDWRADSNHHWQMAQSGSRSR
jgi:hypothetical protein